MVFFGFFAFFVFDLFVRFLRVPPLRGGVLGPGGLEGGVPAGEGNADTGGGVPAGVLGPGGLDAEGGVMESLLGTPSGQYSG